jgi:heat-inducible transcriptional repressor
VELAAVLLARSLGLLAVVSAPRARELQVRHVELIALKDLLGLLVVVLREARVLKQLVSFSTAMDQAELSLLAARLNEGVAGRSVADLRAPPADETSAEAVVLTALRGLLREEEAREGSIHIEGLGNVLGQPEFLDNHVRAGELMALVERRSPQEWVPLPALGLEGVSVLIGQENRAEELRDCSVVAAPYGLGDGLRGVVGVAGPTRMRYQESVAGVRYVAALLQEMLEQVYG